MAPKASLSPPVLFVGGTEGEGGATPESSLLLSLLSSKAEEETGREEEREEETKVDDSREEIFAACSGGIANLSECNVESVYGTGLSPLAPIEFAVKNSSATPIVASKGVSLKIPTK